MTATLMFRLVPEAVVPFPDVKNQAPIKGVGFCILPLCTAGLPERLA